MAAVRLLSATVAIVAIALAAVVGVTARRVIYPVRSRQTRLIRVTDQGLVTIESTPMTRQNGTLGLLYQDEALQGLLGGIVGLNDTEKSVERLFSLPDMVPAPVSGSLVRPIGNTFPTPDTLGLNVQEVIIPTELGDAPAWLFAGVGDQAQTWAIHVHGSLSGREGAFRTVSSMSETGFTSLVPSMRGDGEGPPAARNASALGQTEWRDIDAAVQYALDHSARNVVLVGWSGGATIALRLVSSSAHRSHISGLVLISPVVDWRSSILFSASSASVPKVIAVLATAALSWPPSSSLLGSVEPLRFEELTWTSGQERVAVPTLVIHSKGDRSTPFKMTERFAALNSDFVELVTVEPAEHALEWNADPSLFTKIVMTWCAETQS